MTGHSVMLFQPRDSLIQHIHHRETDAQIGMHLDEYIGINECGIYQEIYSIGVGMWGDKSGL